jgi:hypothetical protein
MTKPDDTISPGNGGAARELRPAARPTQVPRAATSYPGHDPR